MDVRAPWVELRVHGVSGTPAQDMLGCRDVVQVAGDADSSFYRPADSRGRELDGDGHVIEAYHWGKFTSGSWRQGLWLALLPFGMVNAAQFMLPRPGPPPSEALFAQPEQAASPQVRSAARWHAVAGGMLRLIGLALTCMLLLSITIVLLDLTAWQWVPTRSGLRWDAVPGWASAAAVLGSAAVLLFLASFGKENRRREPAAAPDGQKGAPDVPPTDLGRASFFRGDPDAPALRHLHVAAGLTLLALLGFESAAATWGSWASGAWLAVLVVVTVFLGDPERGARGIATGRWKSWRSVWHERILPATTRPVLVISGLLTLVAAVACADRPHSLTQAAAAAPGIDGAAFGVLIVCVSGIAVLFLACGVLAVRTRTAGPAAPPAPYQRFAMGMTAALLSSIGVFLGVGYAAAVCYAWASFLNRGDGPAVEVPPLLQRVAYAWGLTILLLLLVVVAVLVMARCRHREFVDRVRAAFTFGGEPRCRLPERWLPKVATGMFRARLKNLLQPLVWLLTSVGIVLSLAAGIEYWLSRDVDGRCSTRELFGPLRWLSEPQKCDSRNLVIGLGTLALLGLATGLLLLGRGAVRKQSLRRGVNVVWDVIAFWPRAVHPFVPPPYSQLAVADLRQRIRWHLGAGPVTTAPSPAPASHVVVAAHSQGSLIALSALLWLSAEERARVGFLTFGSQLQVQFPRAFPAYVDVEVLRWLLAAYEGRWLNLYRDTDAIAGPVLSWRHSPDRLGTQATSCRLDTGLRVEEDDIDPRTGRRICGPEWRVLDPTPSDPDLQTGPVAVLRGHSDYPADPDWSLALAAVSPSTAAPAPPADGIGRSEPAIDPAPTLAAAPGLPPPRRRTRPVDHGLAPPFSGGRAER